jgi:REP element-mobilizing transposase RayT
LPASAGAAFLAFDKGLDAVAQGPVWLKDPRVADLVVSTLRGGDTKMALYRLGAFVVMPNHVHVLVEPWATVSRITQWIKGTTARGANELLGRSGEPFWQHESFDHWIRDWEERRRITRYIELNPVAAGLAESAERWPWSSAAVAQASACERGAS